MMNWDKKILQEFKWNTEIENKEEKQKLAVKVASLVKDGEVIGFGSGSTSFLAAYAIADRMKKENIKITAIPTSNEIKLLCCSLNIPTTSLLEQRPDWCFDGADEVDKNNWLIKGRGAAMFKEKLNIANSKKTFILVDKSKFVSNLGEKHYIPVECFPIAINYIKEELYKLGAKEIILRKAIAKDGHIITENGNFILDIKFEKIHKDLEKQIKLIPGVIETGLFIDYNIQIL